jgi:hypothetical protein
MKKFNRMTGLARMLATTGIAAGMFCGLTTVLRSGELTSNSTNQPPILKVEPAAEKKAAPKIKLTGAELYAVNCNRCHPERYPTEFNSTQWKTLMMHMRVRANLPADQAKKILKYLQEESGN